MGQRRFLVLMLLVANFYVICYGKSPEASDYQADLFAGLKHQLPHKRYQSNEPNEYNAVQGKNEASDIFDELQADAYDNLVRLVKEMQRERERLSIRYKPNLGKRTQLYK